MMPTPNDSPPSVPEPYMPNSPLGSNEEDVRLVDEVVFGSQQSDIMEHAVERLRSHIASLRERAAGAEGSLSAAYEVGNELTKMVAEAERERDELRERVERAEVVVGEARKVVGAMGTTSLAIAIDHYDSVPHHQPGDSH